MLRCVVPGIVNGVLLGIRIRVGVASIAEVTGIVIVQQVVVARLAVRFDRRSE